MRQLAKFVTLTAAWQLVWGQCAVNIRNNLQSPEPVFTKNSQLLAPAGASLTWNAGENTTISCQSGQLNGFGVSSTSITCKSGTTFAIGGSNVDSTSLTCSQRVTGDIDVTTTTCGNGAGQLRNIGFRLANGQLITYIQVCYNVNTASAMFARHVISGKAINSAIIESYRPSFKVTGTASKVNPATSYTSTQQSTRLALLLRSQTQANKFINATSYMARGHLSPDADGIFRTWQWATYFYVNVAPQWQEVNAGNWLLVEEATRNIAGRLQEDLLVFTGTFGMMTLPQLNGTQVPITLEAGGIEAPKWYWKIIKSTVSNSGIAMITNNDPFRTSMSSSEMLCSSVCSAYGWNNANYAKFSKGFTYCCKVADLMKIIPAIPSEASVANVLKF